MRELKDCKQPWKTMKFGLKSWKHGTLRQRNEQLYAHERDNATKTTSYWREQYSDTWTPLLQSRVRDL
eukprot:1450386-Amphidinium_carterae.2